MIYRWFVNQETFQRRRCRWHASIASTFVRRARSWQGAVIICLRVLGGHGARQAIAKRWKRTKGAEWFVTPWMQVGCAFRFVAPQVTRSVNIEVAPPLPVSLETLTNKRLPSLKFHIVNVSSDQGITAAIAKSRLSQFELASTIRGW